MIVARSLRSIKHNSHSVVSVGTFDGLHRGHQLIVKKVIEQSRSAGRRSVIITFDPHPRTVVWNERIELLTSPDERNTILESMGVEVILIINFTKEFAQLSAKDFFEKYIMHGVGAEEVIVGSDHMFGKDRISGVSDLKKMSGQYGFNLVVVDPVVSGDQRISSSKIRQFLKIGDVEKAAEFLGRPYGLQGTVVEGDKRGLKLGFPTANLKITEDWKIIPANGVYCVDVRVGDSKYHGMLNIGVRPTFQALPKCIIEVHIFEMSEILYGKLLKINFLHRLRDEKRFSSSTELIKQLEKDRNNCKLHINENYQN